MNDLDSMIHRIEALEPCPYYTDALAAVQKAKEDMQRGRTAIHQSNMMRLHGPKFRETPYPFPKDAR